MESRHLPIVLEQGLAQLRLQRTRASEAIALRVGVGEVMCRRGCCHCCHYPVVISPLEGAILYRHLQRQGSWSSDMKHALEAHSKRTLELQVEVWMLSNIPCPMLVEGQCSSYDARPFVCRATFSTADPDLCRPARFSSGTLVDHREETTEFNEALRRVAKAISTRVLHKLVPISTAILLGRLIVENEASLEDLDAQVLAEIVGLGLE